jgi:hypothetical protein
MYVYVLQIEMSLSRLSDDLVSSADLSGKDLWVYIFIYIGQGAFKDKTHRSVRRNDRNKLLACFAAVSERSVCNDRPEHACEWLAKMATERSGKEEMTQS